MYSKEKIKKIIQDIIKNTEDVLYPPACPYVENRV